MILKIHGGVQRRSIELEKDSYVITEDHYLDYLTRTDISNLIPVTLIARVRNSSFLFLGYSLRDWNLRVILHRLWGSQVLDYQSWAIQWNPEELDRRFWNKRNVEILNVQLETYIVGLSQRLQALAHAGDSK